MSEADNNLTVGEQLKQARVAVKLTIDDVSDRTRIPVKYLYWLEKGDYGKMPAFVYVQGFLVKYSKILNLDKKQLVEKYFNERDGFLGMTAKDCLTVSKPKKTPKFIITPKSVAIYIGLIIAIAVIGYFGLEIYSLIRAPEIILKNPLIDKSVNIENQLIQGKILGANILTVNGKIINFNENTGEFNEAINLNEGLNVIELKAGNRAGKTITLIRKIIYNK